MKTQEQNQNSKELKVGVIYALLAYLGWGFFPIYWKFLKHVPSMEILCHRVLWAFVFYTILLSIKKKALIFYWPRERKKFISLLTGAALLMGITSNCFIRI